MLNPLFLLAGWVCCRIHVSVECSLLLLLVRIPGKYVARFAVFLQGAASFIILHLLTLLLPGSCLLGVCAAGLVLGFSGSSAFILVGCSFYWAALIVSTPFVFFCFWCRPCLI
jgi:hypothetical protein